MNERNYFVLCEDNCKFPAMTKEQILAAIAEATGKNVAGVDSAFITKIKELNTGKELAFWLGTQTEYNTQKDSIPNNTYVIITDDTTAEDMNAALLEIKSEVAAIKKPYKTDITELFTAGGGSTTDDLFKYDAFIVRIADGNGNDHDFTFSYIRRRVENRDIVAQCVPDFNHLYSLVLSGEPNLKDGKIVWRLGGFYCHNADGTQTDQAPSKIYGIKY